MRDITIHITRDEMHELIDATEPIELLEAIGYFTTWGLTSMNYDTVNIHRDWHDKTDLVAIYTDTANPGNRFTMGSVWRNERKQFTFHS